MILYYMELLPAGAKIYRCHDYDRHKIWVEHPNAKEISRKQAEQVEYALKNMTPQQAQTLKENIAYFVNKKDESLKK